MSRNSTMIPHLVVKGAAKACEFYQKAFGAVEVMRMPDPSGSERLMHAHLTIDGHDLMLADDFPEYCDGKSKAPNGPSPVTIHLCVENCDAAIAKAAAAGGTVTMPADDMFWGDRYGQIVDPFGHSWSFSHTLTAEQTKAAAAKWAEFCGQK